MNYFNHLADVKHPVPGEMPEPLLNMRNAIEEIDDEEESNFTIMEISLRFPLSLGVYTYVFNNPVDTVDPFGLEGKRYYAKGKGGGGRRPGRVKGGGKQNPGRWHGQPKGPKWGGGPKGGPPLPQPKPGGGEGKPWPYPWPLPLGGEVGEHG